jgi:glycosyltransferase involved in cell wall biosynthesis
MHSLLVNALSVTNPSGRHMLLGHLAQIVNALAGRLRVVVVARPDMAELRAGLGDGVEWAWAPAATRGWFRRSLWERAHLARLARAHGAAVYFTPSGFAARLPPDVAQIVYAQNPWALVPAARRRRDAPKAWLQRRAYRRTMRTAAAVVFISRYLQEAYRALAGVRERRGAVAYAAPAEATRARAAAAAAENQPRQPAQILSVSAMAPHKNAGTLVRAFAAVRAARPEARLVLAGPWPDAGHEREIRQLVESLGLAGAVEFTGFVSRERLDQLYAESRVFCLMSRCESFGIPAVEAQLFGTPVVTSNAGAIPEVCGAGARYGDPDDVAAVAAALQTLLSDDAEWGRLSAAARGNAARFDWEHCSRPLVDLIRERVNASAPATSRVH